MKAVRKPADVDDGEEKEKEQMKKRRKKKKRKRNEERRAPLADAPFSLFPLPLTLKLQSRHDTFCGFFGGGLVGISRLVPSTPWPLCSAVQSFSSFVFGTYGLRHKERLVGEYVACCSLLAL